MFVFHTNQSPQVVPIMDRNHRWSSIFIIDHRSICWIQNFEFTLTHTCVYFLLWCKKTKTLYINKIQNQFSRHQLFFAFVFLHWVGSCLAGISYSVCVCVCVCLCLPACVRVCVQSALACLCSVCVCVCVCVRERKCLQKKDKNKRFIVCFRNRWVTSRIPPRGRENSFLPSLTPVLLCLFLYFLSSCIPPFALLGQANRRIYLVSFKLTDFGEKTGWMVSNVGWLAVGSDMPEMFVWGLMRVCELLLPWFSKQKPGWCQPSCCFFVYSNNFHK